ncbi:hypothetical protein NL676_025800 [Syzygium grande]|nr:hypothetical protein NL676_025800 [Syzygium grande]
MATLDGPSPRTIQRRCVRTSCWCRLERGTGSKGDVGDGIAVELGQRWSDSVANNGVNSRPVSGPWLESSSFVAVEAAVYASVPKARCGRKLLLHGLRLRLRLRLDVKLPVHELLSLGLDVHPDDEWLLAGILLGRGSGARNLSIGGLWIRLA